MAHEALQADALERAGYVDALGVGGARVVPRALVRVDAPVNRIELVTGYAVAPVGALDVHANRVLHTRARIFLALVHI